MDYNFTCYFVCVLVVLFYTCADLIYVALVYPFQPPKKMRKVMEHIKNFVSDAVFMFYGYSLYSYILLSGLIISLFRPPKKMEKNND